MEGTLPHKVAYCKLYCWQYCNKEIFSIHRQICCDKFELSQSHRYTCTLLHYCEQYFCPKNVN